MDSQHISRRGVLLTTPGLLLGLSGCTSVSDVRDGVGLARDYVSAQTDPDRDKVYFHPDDPHRLVYPESVQSAEEIILDTRPLNYALRQQVKQNYEGDELYENGTLISVARAHSWKMAEGGYVGPDNPDEVSAESEYEGTVISFDTLHRFVSKTDIEIIDASGTQVAPTFEELARAIFADFAEQAEMKAVLQNEAVQGSGSGVYFIISELSTGAIVASILTTIDFIEGMELADTTR